MTNLVKNPVGWIGFGVAIVALTLLFAIAREVRLDDKETLSASSAPPTNVASDVATSMIIETNGAIAFWEERIATDPYDFIAATTLADLYLRRSRQNGDVSDIGRAEAALLKSLAVMPTRNYIAEVLLAHLYNTRHEFTRALDSAQSIVARYPREDFGWGVLGDAQLALGRYDEAERSYERMVEIAPGPASFGRMAHVAEIFGDPERARLNWRNALGGGGDAEANAWAATESGYLEFSLGDVEAADQQFEASLEVFPGNTRGLAGLARVAAARGADAQAVELYEQVVDRSPNPIDVIALGDLYSRAGRDAEASQQYGLVRAIGQLYEANAIRFDLAMILFEADHGDTDAALEQAEGAYSERPSIYAADALGWALFRAGRADEARPRADEALRFGTLDASFLYHAGMIAAGQGDEAAARTYLQNALNLNPQFHVLQADEARAALDRLSVQQ